MKTNLIGYICAAFLSLNLLQAQDATTQVINQPVHRIHDGGVDKQFEIARDEVVTTDRSGKDTVRGFAAKASADDVRHHAEQLEASTGEETSLVLYEKGLEHKESNRRLLTTGVLVKLAPGVDADAVAQTVDSKLLRRVDYAPEFVILDTGKPGAALVAVEKLRGLAGVQSAESMLARKQTKKWIPNDSLFSKQWHLRNTGQLGGTPGIDVKPLLVWDSFRGAGIRIGMVDDGLQTTHPDLALNVDTLNGYDWNGGDNDPNPDVRYDDHGTSCAGVAAARGNNTTGVCGAAPEATLVGLRLIAGYVSDQQEADAMNYRNDIIQIKSNSWGPNDDGRTLEGPGPLAQAALANACKLGRGGLGTLIFWAGGNGGNVGDNSNYDGYANSIYTIAVAALSDTGLKADYSERGANLVVTAPSSSSGRPGITTTDLIGSNGYNATGLSPEPADTNFTSTFGGTSSATPLVSGVCALLLQSKPTLGWRDVQEILMKSATKCSYTDTDWVNNAGGFHFNHKFGAGLINADAAVTLAKTWTNLAAQVNSVSAQTGLTVAIPDNNTIGITRTFVISDNLRVEQVTVKLNVTHTYRGDLDITLRSPSGTISKLAEKHSDSGDNYSNWTFMTVRNWSESSKGTWTLIVKDLATGDVGTLSAATLTIFGTGSTTPPPPPPVTTTATFTSTDVPKSIPDNNSTGITSITNVSAAGTISALTVSVNITHPYKGDLVVTLISPSGTSSILQNRAGGSADNVILVNVPLSNFNTQTASGQWKLKIQDLAAQDFGKLNSWSLTVTTQ